MKNKFILSAVLAFSAFLLAMVSCSKDRSPVINGPTFSEKIVAEMGQWNSTMSSSEFDKVCASAQQMNIPISYNRIYENTPSLSGRPRFDSEKDFRKAGLYFISQEKFPSGAANYRSNLNAILWLLNHYNQSIGLNHPYVYASLDGLVKFQDVMAALTGYGNIQLTDFNPNNLAYGDTTMFSPCTYMATYTEPLSLGGVQLAESGFTVFIHCTPEDEVLNEFGNPVFPLNTYFAEPALDGFSQIFIDGQ